MTALEVVQAYFRAMAAGASAAEALLALFDDDATYVEPFSGQPQRHRGRAAIEAYFKASLEQGPADLELTVDRIDVDGDTVRSEWTCTAAAFDGPVRGKDVCVVKAGKIVRLEVRLA